MQRLFKKSYWAYLDLTYASKNKCNPISNDQICTMFGLFILGEMKFNNYISFQMKLNKSTKYKVNNILSQMKFE